METKTIQRDFIINELRTNGFIRRNLCLSKYISRLGAYICLLNKQGWVIEGYKLENGDFEYKVVFYPQVKTAPKHKVIESTKAEQVGLFPKSSISWRA